ncbi:restriction endonuclease subunit S [Pseudogulbenkiania sp. MAI-1]|uniref:restriction endonuclease subunit S n=1 Tax=Pseudogulbenkiania sp. MAI-1 TaxID=990370 RepID=UPI0004AE3B09|nr:restriction endonuclease subunit S [Pseudogulbenkiania sp. MAI-1]
MATDLQQPHTTPQISGPLGDFVEFKNGRSSPDRTDDGAFAVYGSNGAIGKADVTNAPAGTLVVGRVGSYCGSVHYSPNRCWVTDNAIIGSSKSQKDSRFWFYKLTSLGLNNYRAGSGQPLLNQQILNGIEVSIPASEYDRCQIAEILGAFDDKIDLNHRINQTLEAMAQAIFKSWFVDFDPVKAKIAAKQEGRDPMRAAMGAISGKTDAELDALPREQFDQLAATAALFPEEMEDSELGEVPKGWEVEMLGNVTAYLNRGISPKYLESGGVLVLNQKCVRDFRVDISKGRRHDPAQRKIDGRRLEVGDVLVNSTGVGTLGRVAQVLHLAEQTIVDSHVTVVRAGDALSWPYLGQYLVWKQPEIEAMGEGSTGQTELSRAKLASLSVLIPNKAILITFDQFVSPLKSRVSSNDRGSENLAALRETLLPKLLSGELAVDAATDLAFTAGAE